MLDADDYFSTLRRKLGMEREDELVAIQKLLDTWYPSKARAKRIHEGKLYIITESSAVAGELRMRQIELIEVIKVPIQQIIISQSNR